MIADQGHRTRPVNPALAAGVANRDAHQSCAVPCELGKRSETEISLQPGAFHLLPADAGQIAGDQARRDASPPQLVQQHPRAGANAAPKVGTAAHINALRESHHGRHVLPDARSRNAGVRQHAGENVAIEHALHGDTFRGGFEAGSPANGIDQSLAMMRARAAQQGSIDIEKH